MTPQELKNSILQRAIQGRLVPQDPNDEPASVLLDKIRKEKAKLVKAGKIKKEKPLPEITDEEIPFDIPENWAWVRLGEIGQWGAGATPSKSNDAYFKNGTIPWLLTGDLTDGVIKNIPNKITPLAVEQTSVKLNPPGSVLIAMYGATIGKIGILDFTATTNQACCACQTYRGIYNWYLFYFLLSQRTAFRQRGEGGAQPNISKEKILATLIPLPPLSEQRRIVKKLEELLPLVESYEQAWNRLEELNRRFPDDMRKAILQHAIQGRLVPQDPTDEPASVLLDKIRKEKAKLIKAGKLKKEKPLPEITEEEIPFDIPENWTWVRLGDVCNYGQCINAEPSDIPADYWVLDLEDIEKDTGRVLQKKKKEEVKAQSTKHLFKKGDVLYSKLRPYLNKVVLADSDGCCTSEILPLKFGSFIFAPYAQMYLMSPEFIAYTMRFSYGMKMPRLGTMDGKLALFPLPPLAEQKRIVSKLEELLPLCDQLKQRIS